MALIGFLLLFGGASLLASTALHPTGGTLALRLQSGAREFRHLGPLERQRFIGGLTGLAIGVVAVAGVGYDGIGALSMIVSTTLFGLIVPGVLLDRRRQQYLRQVEGQIAEAAAMIAVTLRAGYGLDAALTSVAREMDAPLGLELATLGNEVSLGVPRSEALERLRERLPCTGVTRFVQAVAFASDVGSGLSPALTVLAEETWTGRFQRAREQAAKLPVKILAPTILLIFPPMLLIVAGPAMLDIYRALSQ